MHIHIPSLSLSLSTHVPHVPLVARDTFFAAATRDAVFASARSFWDFFLATRVFFAAPREFFAATRGFTCSSKRLYLQQQETLFAATIEFFAATINFLCNNKRFLRFLCSSKSLALLQQENSLQQQETFFAAARKHFAVAREYLRFLGYVFFFFFCAVVRGWFFPSLWFSFYDFCVSVCLLLLVAAFCSFRLPVSKAQESCRPFSSSSELRLQSSQDGCIRVLQDQSKKKRF